MDPATLTIGVLLTFLSFFFLFLIGLAISSLRQEEEEEEEEGKAEDFEAEIRKLEQQLKDERTGKAWRDANGGRSIEKVIKEQE